MSEQCDICYDAATVERPATRNRERAVYCDDHARMYLGWGDSYRRLVPFWR